MKLYQSSQDYLETILMLSEKLNNKVKSIDVAHELNVTKQSVHRALKNLNENGYLTFGEHSYITLTDKGLEVAQEMLERHTVLTEYFISIGVSEATASVDACNVEHYISKETFEAIKKTMQKK